MFFSSLTGTGDTAGNAYTPTKIIGGEHPIVSTSILDLLEADLKKDTPFKVIDHVPSWLATDSRDNNTLLVKFLQYYYDWLYSSKDSGLYVDDYIDLMDIDNITEETKGAFVSSFIPDIDVDGLDLTVDQVKDVLRAVKTNIFQKKGTQEALATLFTKIFPEIQSVSVERGNLEFTIQLRITDDSIRNYDVYETVYRNLFHPVGMCASIQIIHSFGSEESRRTDDTIIERELSRSGATSTGFDSPRIGNYFVYNMNDAGSLAPSSGASGTSNPRGITGAGSTANVSNLPTYNHPNWLYGISGGTSLGTINIRGLMSHPLSRNNPNLGITQAAS